MRLSLPPGLATRARAAARRRGFDVVRYRSLASWLGEREISVVFDVGANDGAFGSGLRADGYPAALVSFEPGRAAFERLSARAEADARWEAVNCALGSAPGKGRLMLSAKSEYSSLLEPDPSSAWRDSAAEQVATEEVEVRRVADEVAARTTGSERCFLKIDAQGSDLDVLEGAREVMDRFVGVQVELSFAPLYRGQPPADELLRFVRECGFDLWAVRPVLTAVESGRTFEADAIFFRA